MSSHGIDQKRVLGFDFNVKCLTNISHDHLDYHKTFENYKSTKMHFMIDYPGNAIYSEDLSLINAEKIPQLTGDFHQKNVTSAMAICHAVGRSDEELLPLLSHLKAPQGRFQTIDIGQPFKVIVDFAHTPDALAMVLQEAFRLVNHKKKRLELYLDVVAIETKKAIKNGCHCRTV